MESQDSANSDDGKCLLERILQLLPNLIEIDIFNV
jgi:hypothetical protein